MEKTKAESDAANVKAKRQKVGVVSIPKKRSKGKVETIITKEQLDKALDGIKAEEHKSKKKKQALVPIVTPIFEVTPAMKKMANECAADLNAKEMDQKAQYIQERDEKLKALGFEKCDEYFKEKSAEVKAIAGEAAGKEAGTSEAVPQAAVPQPTASESTSVVDNSIKVCQIPNPSINIEPPLSNSPVHEPIEDNSILDNLISHCSGELQDPNLNSEKASETASEAVAFEKVISESPQQHTPEP
jgi:hypothetical protein